jgi:hypothetical protein
MYLPTLVCKVPFCVPSPVLVPVSLFDDSYSYWDEVYLIVVLMYISLMISDGEHFFIYLLLIWMFIWAYYLFLIGLFEGFAIL